MWPLSIGLPSRVLPSCVVHAFDVTPSDLFPLNPENPPEWRVLHFWSQPYD